MTTFVLTRPENSKSAVKLGYPTVTDERQIPEGSNVIRWGNGMTPDRRGWEVVLNKAAALAVSTDKLEALRKLSRVVNTPEVFVDGDILPRGHRYVCRPANHAEGSDFELVNGGTQLHGHHATRFIEDTREYRVWFVRDKYLCAKRVPRSSEGQSPDDPCRSKWGYGEYVTIFSKLKEEMAKARQAIPLDFGAVDVLWSESEGKWYFLEFNSAPSLDTSTLVKHFQTHLQAIVGAPAIREVVEAVRPTPRPVERQPERRPVTPSGATSYEARMRAKFEAEKAAIDERIRREVFGD